MDAVIFDLDDTLIVGEDTARAALAEALTSVGASPEVDRALGAIREVWRAPHITVGVSNSGLRPGKA